MSDFKNLITEKARKAGFHDIGFAEARPMSNEMKYYREWVYRGMNAQMHYLDKNYDKKEDVRLVLPGARTVIALAMKYNTQYCYPEDYKEKKLGLISRYAWGSDYHDIIGKKMKAMLRELKELYPGEEFKSYVDTGPTMDKQWAVRAGIGWQGKNGNILSRKHGSYFFIGLIITTVKVKPDEKVKDYCGKCTACMDSCPTGAIVQPKVVNAGRCLSYWTIEAKPEVEIPPDIALNADNRIFGCDICQEVCPWNSKPEYSDEPLFEPRGGEIFFTKEKIDGMTEGEFHARFRKSPVKRTKLTGLRRNANAILPKKT